jgi:hypothetical protein
MTFSVYRCSDGSGCREQLRQLGYANAGDRDVAGMFETGVHAPARLQALEIRSALGRLCCHKTIERAYSSSCCTAVTYIHERKSLRMLLQR